MNSRIFYGLSQELSSSFLRYMFQSKVHTLIVNSTRLKPSSSRAISHRRSPVLYSPQAVAADRILRSAAALIAPPINRPENVSGQAHGPDCAGLLSYIVISIFIVSFFLFRRRIHGRSVAAAYAFAALLSISRA